MKPISKEFIDKKLSELKKKRKYLRDLRAKYHKTTFDYGFYSEQIYLLSDHITTLSKMAAFFTPPHLCSGCGKQMVQKRYRGKPVWVCPSPIGKCKVIMEPVPGLVLEAGGYKDRV
jgi:hypothetical protein